MAEAIRHLVVAASKYCAAHDAIARVLDVGDRSALTNSMNLPGVWDYVWYQVSEAGLPVRQPSSMTLGQAPVEGVKMFADFVATLPV